MTTSTPGPDRVASRGTSDGAAVERAVSGGSGERDYCREAVELLGLPGAERELLRTLVAWLEADVGGPVGVYARVGGCEELLAASDDGGVWPDRLSGDTTHSWRAGGARIVAREARREPTAALLALVALAVRLELLERRLKHEDFLSRYRGVELEALYDVGLAITGTLDLDTLGEEILFRAVSLLDARRGALYGVDNGGYQLTRAIGGDAAATIPDDHPIEAGLVLPGAQHLLATPIEVDGQRRGLLVVADKESRTGVGAFGDKDERTLALFANQAALALETARLHRDALEKERLEREMELASRIQQEILPDQLPEPQGWELCGWSRPARQVGGDYYDAFGIEDGKTMLVLGDVTGKGMPAALLVSTLHSALRLLSDRGLELGALLARLNLHVCESSASNKFITCFLGELEPAIGRVTWANAGHNPPLVIRASGEAEELPASGIPIGLLPVGAWTASELVLGPGDMLCVYSDGITEAATVDEEEYGPRRLTDLLRRMRSEPLAAIKAALIDEVAQFVGDQPPADDQTVLLVRRA